MNLPVVKLIDESTKTYTFNFGNRTYGFRRGATEPVPVALALRLKKILNRKGDSMFDVKGLPEIIKSNNQMMQCSLFS